MGNEELVFNEQLIKVLARIETELKRIANALETANLKGTDDSKSSAAAKR
jgi:hypothetical protein